MTEKLDKPYQIRLSEEFWRDLDEWRRKQPDIPSRAEAVRQLVGLQLNKQPLTASIYRLPIPKKKLATLGDTERRLVLVLGHAANELLTLQRLTVFLLGGEWKDEVCERIASGQANVLVRLLSGKVWETIELIRDRVQCNKTAMQYVAKMPDEGRNAFDWIRQRWGAEEGAILPALRKFHAFHYPSNDKIDEAFADTELSPDESLEIYLSNKGVDGDFFQASDVIFALAMSHTLKGGKFGERWEKVTSLIVDASGNLTRFIHHYTGAIFEHGSDVLDTVVEPTEVPATDLSDIAIPPVSVRSKTR